ncbi:hypothetical protein D3C72_2014010 [compost metagenome]
MTKGSTASEIRAAPTETSTVLRKVSLPDLTMAFQLACSKAANRTTATTRPDMWP